MSDYRLGYFHGWSDKKAGRAYGESSSSDIDAQWNRIAAVVRAARREKRTGYRDRLALDEALDALTADDIEVIKDK